jgi:hypothetical protein
MTESPQERKASKPDRGAEAVTQWKPYPNTISIFPEPSQALLLMINLSAMVGPDSSRKTGVFDEQVETP